MTRFASYCHYDPWERPRSSYLWSLWDHDRIGRALSSTLSPCKPSSSKPARGLEEGALIPCSSVDEIDEDNDLEDEVSFVDSEEVDSVVRALMSDGESTTLEDEDPPEVIPEDDDETLDDLYMPPSGAGSATFVQADSDWRKMCLANKFCVRGF